MTGQDKSLTKKRGRPPGVTHGSFAGLRLPPELSEHVDRWREALPDPKPSRSEAIRRLIEAGLAAQPHLSPADAISKAKKVAAQPVPEKPSPARGEALLKKGLAEVVLKNGRTK